MLLLNKCRWLIVGVVNLAGERRRRTQLTIDASASVAAASIGVDLGFAGSLK